MKTALMFAWEWYTEAVGELLQREYERAARKEPLVPSVIFPPTAERITIIQAAIDQGRKQGLKEALDLIVPLCDHLDNEHRKSHYKEIRPLVEQVYKSLYSLWNPEGK